MNRGPLERAWRKSRTQLRTPIAHFVLVGAASTIAYLFLYLVLRSPLGPAGANAVALAVTAVANTQANRRFTFGVRGRKGLVRQHAGGGAVYVLALGITVGALTLLHDVDHRPAQLLELTVLLVASALATLSRYAILRTWVFARRGSDSKTLHPRMTRPSSLVRLPPASLARLPVARARRSAGPPG
jgi:putative flippase GtrA